VVSEHLGVVLGPAERPDPFRGQAMLLRAPAAGDLPVGDIADQHVEERILRLVCDGRTPGSLHEVLALQRVQLHFRLPSVHPLRKSHGAQPEDLAHHRGSLQERLLPGRQSVEPRGDDALHGLRQR